VVIPVEPHVHLRLVGPRLTERQWARMLTVLEVMKPGLLAADEPDDEQPNQQQT
jgi:hypothetical protein